jgi:arylsulfatase A-like enzyme
MGGLMVGATALQYWPVIVSRCSALHGQWWLRGRSLVRKGVFITGMVVVGVITVRMIMMAPEARSQVQFRGMTSDRPNFVMIALDTARADHLSAYGYTKATTPNLDRLASHGVLYETAVAPASWTLPSFATVLTGRLPHQNHTSWEMPLAKGSSTLASILRSRGYQTAGFNANGSFGTARAGLAQGFDLYDDNDGTLSSNLASIDVVKAFWWFVYYPFIQPQDLTRRNAGMLNQAVVRWFRHRSTQPFLVLLNYVDAHEPYSEIPEVGNQFGDARRTVSERIRAEVDDASWGIDVPRSPAEQTALIAGYDSGIAYADRQIGSLLQLFASCPEWSNTYVIVFGDHGQSFGTHRRYGHGWGLNRELLHVPLIIAGPGIPMGRRVKDLVGLQQLFATVLDLSAGGTAVPEKSSLRCSWMLPTAQCGSAPMVISELGAAPDAGITSPSISLVTPEWHFIRDAADDLQLYDLTRDPGEQVNLAGSPEHRADVAALEGQLFEQVEKTSIPWLGEDYLWALGEREFGLLAREHRVRTNWPYQKSPRPTAQEDELLHSLPYQ